MSGHFRLAENEPISNNDGCAWSARPFSLAQWQAEPDLGLIDLRSAEDFETRHVRGSTSLPWPIGTRDLSVDALVKDFEEREYVLVAVFHDCPAIWSEAEKLDAIETNSKNSKRLWEPSPVLGGVIEEIETLREADGLKKAGFAIDLACGSARDGVFLALRGWKTMNYDYSKPQIERAHGLAKDYGVADNVVLEEADVVQEQARIAKEHTCDLLNISRYLDRSLWPFLRSLVQPGGFVVYHTFMDGCAKPRRDQFKLKTGELAQVFGEKEGFDVIHDKVITISDGRPTSWFLARRKVSAE